MGSKHWIGAAMAAGLACNLAWAQEQVRARVISAVPVMQQVAVPQQLCDNEEADCPSESAAGLMSVVFVLESRFHCL